MSEALLDVNPLIAGVVENHAGHERARLLHSALERFHTTPTTQGGFLRFLTRPWKDNLKQEQPPRLTRMIYTSGQKRKTPNVCWRSLLKAKTGLSTVCRKLRSSENCPEPAPVLVFIGVGV
jgi:predicted nucleic acid-binding protein